MCKYTLSNYNITIIQLQTLSQIIRHTCTRLTTDISSESDNSSSKVYQFPQLSLFCDSAVVCRHPFVRVKVESF